MSRLCHEPRAGLAVLEGMLAPYRSGRRLRVLLRHRPVAEVEGISSRPLPFSTRRPASS